MAEHELKVWPEFWPALASGEKTFELRKDDRGFRAGDILWLREWSKAAGYTGDYCIEKIILEREVLGIRYLEFNPMCYSLSLCPFPGPLDHPFTNIHTDCSTVIPFRDEARRHPNAAADVQDVFACAYVT